VPYNAQHYLLHTGLPAIVKSIQLLNKHITFLTVQDKLVYYGMTYLCTCTVSKWLNQLRYAYFERKKERKKERNVTIM
jgi:hypothetical protein